MTTNIERATEVVRDVFNSMSPSITLGGGVTVIAQALADAGLLMPDLPGPNSTIDGEPSWEVQREDEHFEIGMYDDFSGITFDNYTTGAMISLPPSDMREAAYALLAAANHAEQEQDNG